MKRLEEIKEEYAIVYCRYPSWEDFINDIARHEVENHMDEIAKRYADECAKEALRLASEGLIEWSYERHPNFRTAIASIISETNLPRHISSKELDEDIKVVVDKNFYDLL